MKVYFICTNSNRLITCEIPRDQVGSILSVTVDNLEVQRIDIFGYYLAKIGLVDLALKFKL